MLELAVHMADSSTIAQFIHVFDLCGRSHRVAPVRVFTPGDGMYLRPRSGAWQERGLEMAADTALRSASRLCGDPSILRIVASGWADNAHLLGPLHCFPMGFLKVR